LAGWAVTYASAGLTLYAIVILTVFHLRILWYEEPRLAAGFGAAWIRYRENVRRWL
jgi:protein-S-isoprenylcysteine O-methyltransferase Ste14